VTKAADDLRKASPHVPQPSESLLCLVAETGGVADQRSDVLHLRLDDVVTGR